MFSLFHSYVELNSFVVAGASLVFLPVSLTMAGVFAWKMLQPGAGQGQAPTVVVAAHAC